jgi:predicted NBD/HSP70 family sugar kinase
VISLGIDIGGTSVKAAAREGDRTLWTGQSDFYSKPDTDALRAAIRQAVGGRVKAVDGVGLCAPGLLDPARRMITFAINVPGIAGVPLDRLLADSLHITVSNPVRVVNDAGATAFDLFSSRKTTGRLVVLTLGTGIGMAVLDDGKSLGVEGDSPGHVGQIDVSIPGHDVVGPDGGAGGLEGYLGVAALRAAYGGDVSAAIAKFTGDEPAVLALVRAIRIVHAIYRPNHIVLCGGVGIRLRHLIPRLRVMIETKLTSLARSGWTLTAGDDDFHAARGAAMLATQPAS